MKHKEIARKKHNFLMLKQIVYAVKQINRKISSNDTYRPCAMKLGNTHTHTKIYAHLC